MYHGLALHHNLMSDHLARGELRFSSRQRHLLLLLLLLLLLFRVSLLLSLLVLEHVKLRLLLQLSVFFRFARRNHDLHFLRRRF